MTFPRLILLLLVVAGPLAWAHWPAKPLPPGTKADRLVITKSSRTLEIYQGGVMVRGYKISLGREPVGPKQREGDGKTPEGIFRITEHKRDSAYHRALRLSYPEPADVARARAAGVSAGSNIMIHGIMNRLGVVGRLHRLFDWTAGCIAVTNAEIEQLWDALDDGTVVEIRS